MHSCHNVDIYNIKSNNYRDKSQQVFDMPINTIGYIQCNQGMCNNLGIYHSYNLEPRSWPI